MTQLTQRLRMGRTVTERRVSKDALFGGRVTLFQPAHGTGYRANVDAILLAAFAAHGGRRARLAIDLGAGVGAVGMTLFYLQVAERVQFVEKDEFLAELCRRNVQANQWDARAVVRVLDLSHDGDIAGGAALVVANPPYVSPERDGRIRPPESVAGRLAARGGRLAPFVRAAAAVLGRRGRACFVYPAHALLELTTLARQSGLEPKRLRFVHGRAERPARIALVELVSAKPGGLVVAPPLIEVGNDGKPTAELAALLRPP